MTLKGKATIFSLHFKRNMYEDNSESNFFNFNSVCFCNHFPITLPSPSGQIGLSCGTSNPSWNAKGLSDHPGLTFSRLKTIMCSAG